MTLGLAWIYNGMPGSGFQIPFTASLMRKALISSRPARDQRSGVSLASCYVQTSNTNPDHSAARVRCSFVFLPISLSLSLPAFCYHSGAVICLTLSRPRITMLSLSLSLSFSLCFSLYVSQLSAAISEPSSVSRKIMYLVNVVIKATSGQQRQPWSKLAGRCCDLHQIQARANGLLDAINI